MINEVEFWKREIYLAFDHIPNKSREKGLLIKAIYIQKLTVLKLALDLINNKCVYFELRSFPFRIDCID